MHSLREFLQLPWSERRLVLEAGCCLMVLRLASWVMPFGTLRRMVDAARARARAVRGGNGNGEEAARIAQASLDLRPASIGLPQPSRSAPHVRLEQLPPAQAFMRLNAYPRDVGWRIAEPVRRYFEQAGAIAKAVPVWQAEIPWWPPFPPELVAALGLDT